MEITPETIWTGRQVRRAERVNRSRRLSLRRRGWEMVGSLGFRLMAAGICFLVLAVAVTLFAESWPLLARVPLVELLSGVAWHPMQGQFGFAPFIIGSLSVTLTAMVIAVPLAILCGIYLAEYTSTRTRSLLKPLLDLLVGIPSVIYGLWAVLFVVPLIREDLGPWVGRTVGSVVPFFAFTNPSGYSLLAAAFVLAVMVFPLIVAVTEEVLRSIPREMREAILCLGATRWEATKCVVRRVGLTGMLAAVVLGFSRAFGETLAVMMVVGNVAQVPNSIFDAAYPLPALIANNYGEMMSVPLYEAALMMAALLLLAVVVAFNLAARFVIVRIGAKE